MAKEREPVTQNLNTIGDDDILGQIVEGFAKSTFQSKPLDNKQINEIAEKTDFISRQPRKKRSKTKYKAQLNIKVREGIKPLFQEISAYLETFDNETFELALLALIEKKGTKEHLTQFKGLTK